MPMNHGKTYTIFMALVNGDNKAEWSYQDHYHQNKTHRTRCTGMDSFICTV